MTQTALLVFARGIGLAARAPGFSHPAVPPVVRAGVALALAFAVAPGVQPVAPLDPFALALAVAGEAAVGAAIGLGASLVYDGAYYGGRLIDDYIGFKASVPSAAVVSAQGFGRLWSSLFTAALFFLNGYAVIIDAFASSFTHLAPAATLSATAWTPFALALPATIVRTALLVAAPAIAVACTVQIALAAVARVVPRFQSFPLSFPLVFAAAAIVALATLPLEGGLGPAAGIVTPWGPVR